jgi:hypothetical protein
MMRSWSGQGGTGMPDASASLQHHIRVVAVCPDSGDHDVRGGSARMSPPCWRFWRGRQRAADYMETDCTSCIYFAPDDHCCLDPQRRGRAGA